MLSSNIRSIWTAVRSRSPAGVHLFTADGSVDCTLDPGEQEATTAHLHFCEVVCGLGSLAVGGALVVKMFTLFEHRSASLLALLRSCLDSLVVAKPRVSKQGNSEVYIVGRGFRGIDIALLEQLLHVVDCPDTSRALIPGML
jgi:cap2 methyltransferase